MTPEQRAEELILWYARRGGADIVSHIARYISDAETRATDAERGRCEKIADEAAKQQLECAKNPLTITAGDDDRKAHTHAANVAGLIRNSIRDGENP